MLLSVCVSEAKRKSLRCLRLIQFYIVKLVFITKLVCFSVFRLHSSGRCNTEMARSNFRFGGIKVNAWHCKAILLLGGGGFFPLLIWMLCDFFAANKCFCSLYFIYGIHKIADENIVLICNIESRPKSMDGKRGMMIMICYCI